MAKKKSESKAVPKEGKVEERKGSWYYTGEEGVRIKKQQDAVASLKKEKAVSRFRLAPGESAKIVFVDDTGFFVYEHNLAIGGKFGNFVTCTKDFAGGCAVCDKGMYPTLTGYYTIIDPREFTRKSDSKKVKNRKILFPAKKTMIFLLDELKKKKGSLVGLVVEVKRYTKEGTNCGEAVDAGPKIDIAKKLGADAAKPIDYLKVLAAPTKDELMALGFGAPTIVGSEEDVTDASLDDLF